MSITGWLSGEGEVAFHENMKEVFRGKRISTCARDTQRIATLRRTLADVGIRVGQTPYQGPNANAYAKRFVRSIEVECSKRGIPFGERHLRRTIAEFVEHYHRERNHQGLDNELIAGAPPVERGNRIRRHQRLGGLLNYYCRAA